MSKKYEINWNAVDWDYDEKGPEIKSNQSVAISDWNRFNKKGTNHSEKTKQKISDGIKNSDTYKDNQQKGMNRFVSSEDWKPSQMRAAESRAANPDWKKNQRKGIDEFLEENPEWRKKQSEHLTRVNKSRIKAIVTPDGEFESQKAAAEFYGISHTGMIQRMKRKPDLYYFKKDDPSKSS